MLQHLHISDLAVVAQMDLEFTNGMTVITGETGAGKSIVLDALKLVLGERAESRLVRPGSEKAQITATFDISALPGAICWLTDLELGGENGQQECQIRRVVYANGRSRAFINGLPVTGSQLKLLGEYLVQMHGQHQHQQLLKSSEQLRLLDAFGDHPDALARVAKAFQHWQKLAQEKEQLLEHQNQDDGRLRLLRYQFEELTALALEKDELEQLHHEHQQLTHAQSDIQTLQNASHVLNDGDSHSIQNRLLCAHNDIATLTERYPELKECESLLNDAHIHIEEAASTLRQMENTLEYQPERLSEIDARLQSIHDMARKHKVAPETLPLHYQQLTDELAQLENGHLRLQEIDGQLQEAQTHYEQCGKQLSKVRKSAAKQLEKEINCWMGQLGMPGGRLEIEWTPHADKPPRLSGLERLSFLVSTNPGHPVQPLNKVASGGELSRMSLAILLIIAKYLNTPLLVFDEVDVGVGGKIGAMIGQALKALGKNVQVLCVTHLPQVAACGHQHIVVEKHRKKNQTTTTIRMLSKNERVEEVARMLGGMDVSAHATAQAKDLLAEVF